MLTFSADPIYNSSRILTSWTEASVNRTKTGRLPRRSNKVCILIPPLFSLNVDHGYSFRHRLIVLLSKAYTKMSISKLKLSSS